MKHKIALFILLFASICSFGQKPKSLLEGFKTPPVHTRPYVWWHWINGNISKEGITNDLEEMSKQGIGGVTMFDLGGGGEYPTGKVVFRSPEWDNLFAHAVKEANRLGLDFGFMNCDGYGTSGGPWVKPDDAMKQITFSKIAVKGPVTFSDTLPQPATTDNYYKDLSVFACPVVLQNWNIRKTGVKISCSSNIKEPERLIDNDFINYSEISAKDNIENQYVQFQFDQPFRAASLVLFSVFRYNPIEIEVQSSDDGKNFSTIGSFSSKTYVRVEKFQETTARYFRVIFKTAQMYMAKYSNQLRLVELALLQKDEIPYSLPAINEWELKSGLWFNYDNKFADSDHSQVKGIVPSSSWVDLTSKLDKDGKLNWQVPAGNWKVIRMGYTLTGAVNGPATDAGRGLECDKLDKRGIEASFAGYVAKMAEQNSAYVGKGLNMVLIDSYEAGPQNWTQILPDEFLKRRGYDIRPWLPVLAGEAVNSVEESERFLWDYRRTLADLFADNFLGHMRELCNKAGLKFVSEAANSEGTPMCDAINYTSKTDIPMNEFWAKPEPDLKMAYNYGPDGTFKDVISAAHIYNKPIIASESFSCFVGNWQHYPNLLKAQTDLALCQGVNRLTMHSYTHQFDETYPGLQMNPWGIALNRKLTWWPMANGWFNYIARCQSLLQKGNYVADALVFTGEGVPATIKRAYGENMFDLLPKGYNYDACNVDVLNRAKVIDGKIVLENGVGYSVLILPDEPEMTVAFISRLKELVQAGAVVYGKKPERSPGLANYLENDQKVKELAAEVWGNCDGISVRQHLFGKGKVLFGMGYRQLFDTIKVRPDFSYSSVFKDNDVQFIHKKIDDVDIYFLSNQKDHAEELNCVFRVSGKAPEFWHPEDGSTEKASVYKLQDGITSMPLRLEGHGSVFVVFSGNAGNSIVSVTRNGRELFPKFAEDSTFASAPTYKEIFNAKDQFCFAKAGKYEFRKTDGEVFIIDVPEPDSVQKLNGSWDVSFTRGWKAPENATLDSLFPLNLHTDAGIRYYSGIVTYTKEIEIAPNKISKEKLLLLDLGDFRDVASVSLNGKDLGVVWRKPFQTDITSVVKPGKNLLVIKIANSWANRVIGDMALPEKERVTWSNHSALYPSWLGSDAYYTKDSPLIPSGLFGPVTIKTLILKK